MKPLLLYPVLFSITTYSKTALLPVVIGKVSSDQEPTVAFVTSFVLVL